MRLELSPIASHLEKIKSKIKLPFSEFDRKPLNPDEVRKIIRVGEPILFSDIDIEPLGGPPKLRRLDNGFIVREKEEITESKYRDQIHKFYLAELTGPRVTKKSWNGSNVLLLDSETYARIFVSTSHGIVDLQAFSTNLRVPQSAEIRAVGHDQLNEWRNSWVDYEQRYQKMMELLSARTNGAHPIQLTR